jgi:hypothetical protein
MTIFINEAIDIGIKNYLKNNNEQIDTAHSFETKVIILLINIYGEINIINPYKLNDQKAFTTNLAFYGLPYASIQNFIKLMDEYENWLTSSNTPKNDILEKISIILMEMVLYKNKSQKINQTEYSIYDDFFNYKEQFLHKINEISSINPEKVPFLWNIKKAYFSFLNNRKFTFKPILPNLLSEEQYKAYGISMKEVNQLSNQAIAKLNDKILSDIDDENAGGRNKSKPLQLVLTSGSGFVDTIVLLSIMATEIMVGLIIAITIAGR